MTDSANGHIGTFDHVVQSLPDYSEIIIILLILILLMVSLDEIIDFIYVVKEIFTYKGMPFN